MHPLSSVFTDELPGDPDQSNISRQVSVACYSEVLPKGMASPLLISLSTDMAEELNLDAQYCHTDEFAGIMTGTTLAKGSKPYAMCYGGHQFGHWAGQLGDGRAINLGELISKGRMYTLQLKGAGPTPYSRGADGFAVLRSSVREFLCSEAMYHLGVPTTRALSLCLTGEQVIRDMMYNGNPAPEKGAIVCRVAPSFIRFGNFEILASRGDVQCLQKLADFTIKHHFPHLLSVDQKYLTLFREVADLTCRLITEWQRVGFVHGVMNTDNMSIMGLTIDYGPYGWLDDYDPDWTPNTTDLPGRRYRYGHQPMIAQWNLLKLANALYPLTGNEETLKDVIGAFRIRFMAGYQTMMKAKCGLYDHEDDDESLIYNLEELLKARETDMTMFFRLLSEVTPDKQNEEIYTLLEPAFYEEDEENDTYLQMFMGWFDRYRERLKAEKVSNTDKKTRMNQVNPKYVLRNYMAQLAIEAADRGDYSVVEELRLLLRKPYEEQPEMQKWFARRPDWAREKVGCSMLSCSS